jgi:hypothetical protein
MELVGWHWSGKHHRVVKGINLTTLLWTDGEQHIPIDYRLYEKVMDGATKNDHFRAMVQTAKQRGFTPKCVEFDSWFGSLDNFKLIRSFGAHLADQTQAQSAGEPRQHGRSSGL